MRWLVIPLALGCAAEDLALSEDAPAPDFSLVDENPTSATFDQAVSPRDHLDQVSAWYFGHAT